MQPALEAEPMIETPGDDWWWPIELLGDNDQPVDLTGCTFDGAAIKWHGGELPLTIENGRLSVDAPAGAVTVKVERADSISVPPNRSARLVMRIVDSLGQRSTVVIIPIRIQPT